MRINKSLQQMQVNGDSDQDRQSNEHQDSRRLSPCGFPSPLEHGLPLLGSAAFSVPIAISDSNFGFYVSQGESEGKGEGVDESDNALNSRTTYPITNAPAIAPIANGISGDDAAAARTSTEGMPIIT